MMECVKSFKAAKSSQFVSVHSKGLTPRVSYIVQQELIVIQFSMTNSLLHKASPLIYFALLFAQNFWPMFRVHKISVFRKLNANE